MTISEALLPEFDLEMANTRKMLERAPQEKWGWKPHAKSFPLGDLAAHVANVPSWVTTVISQDSLNIAPEGGQQRQLPKTTAEMLSQFDGFVAAARAAIAGAQDEQLMKPWALMAGSHTIFSMPKAAVLRTFVMNHLIHHRGQLSIYLRLNDVPIPGMYGPSADESQG